MTLSQLERHAKSIWAAAQTGFPYYGISPLWIWIGVAVLVAGAVAYSVAGKGRGSHAGREQIRRAYRRELAREMAKEDAAKIRAGTAKRKRWMQW